MSHHSATEILLHPIVVVPELLAWYAAASRVTRSTRQMCACAKATACSAEAVLFRAGLVDNVLRQFTFRCTWCCLLTPRACARAFDFLYTSARARNYRHRKRGLLFFELQAQNIDNATVHIDNATVPRSILEVVVAFWDVLRGAGLLSRPASLCFTCNLAHRHVSNKLSSHS